MKKHIFTFAALTMFCAPLFAAANEVVSYEHKSAIFNSALQRNFLMHPLGGMSVEHEHEIQFPESWDKEQRDSFMRRLAHVRKNCDESGIFLLPYDVKENVLGYIFVSDLGKYLHLIPCEKATLEGHKVQSVACSKDGSTLATLAWDGTINLWDPMTLQCIATLEGPKVNSLACSPDGSMLAAIGGRTIYLLDTATHSCIGTLEGREYVNCLAVSPSGKTLAFGSYDKGIKLWDTETQQCITALKHGKVRAVSYSQDGSMFASGSQDGIIKVCNAATFQCIATFEGHSTMVTSVAFSPDCNMLASGSQDATIKLWNIATHQCIATLEGHRGFVNCVAFSPNGKRLASGSHDKSIKMWDTTTHSCIATLEGHRDMIWSVSYSPDGSTLASGSQDGTVKQWSTRDDLTDAQNACVMIIEQFYNPAIDENIPACFERIAANTNVPVEALTNIWNPIATSIQTDKFTTAEQEEYLDQSTGGAMAGLGTAALPNTLWNRPVMLGAAAAGVGIGDGWTAATQRSAGQRAIRWVGAKTRQAWGDLKRLTGVGTYAQRANNS